MFTKKEICNFVDLTSLNSYDSYLSITNFLDNALAYEKQGYKVAAVCFYPNFASLAVEKLKNSDIKVAVVAGGFPSSQSYLSTKLNECELALISGVDEIDIVLNLGAFDDGNYKSVVDEIKAFKGLIKEKCLKVILETGYLKTRDRIKLASQLSIEGGADFIKTSTGKDFPGASLEAVEIMAEAISHKKTGIKTGIKVSGGVRTYEDAMAYTKIIEKYLGKGFLNPDQFRIGASSLITNLMNE